MITLLNNLLFVLQNEHYEVRRFLRLIISLKKHLLHKTHQSPQWTAKAYIGLVLSIALFVAGPISAFVVTSNMVFALSMILVSILLYPIYFAISFSVLHWLTTKYYHTKGPKARRILEKNHTKVVAIVGSYGKTTMKHIVAELLQAAGKQCSYTPGNVNTLEGIIQWVCHEYEKHPTEYCIIEMGEHYVGDIDEICKVVPVYTAIITGATYQHYERFGSADAIVETLLEVVPYVNAHGSILYNADSEMLHAYIERHYAAHDLFEQYTHRDVTDVKTLPQLGGTEFVYAGDHYHTKLIGTHIPAVITAGLKLLAHLGIHQSAEAVRKIRCIEHRMQLIHNPQSDITILDDAYNGNLEGYKSMFALLRNAKREGYVIYITPGILEAGDMSQQLHEQVAHELAKTHMDELWLIKTPATKELQHALRQSGYEGNIHNFRTMHDALALLSHYRGQHCLVVIQNDWPELYSYI